MVVGRCKSGYRGVPMGYVKWILGNLKARPHGAVREHDDPRRPTENSVRVRRDAFAVERKADVSGIVAADARMFASRLLRSPRVPGVCGLGLSCLACPGADRGDGALGIHGEHALHVRSKTSHAVNEPIMVCLPRLASAENSREETRWYFFHLAEGKKAGYAEGTSGSCMFFVALFFL
jgi:hypothetical protein